MPDRAARGAARGRGSDVSDSDRLAWRIPDFGKAIGKSRQSVYRLIWAGALKPIIIGKVMRISAAEAERFLRERESAAALAHSGHKSAH